MKSHFKTITVQITVFSSTCQAGKMSINICQITDGYQCYKVEVGKSWEQEEGVFHPLEMSLDSANRLK